MTTPADTFARFVDIVSTSLDDSVDGGELARRAHLSRFHFDRVVSALSGEPPAAFRRRIRLERAAHELTGTSDTVIEIAIRAGYGSHEAFTRAFTRAFGEPPSEWRAGVPRSFRLPAPSGVHFHPQGGLTVPARGKVTSMDLLQRIVRHHVWVVGEIVDRLDRIAEQDLDLRIEVSVEYIDDRPTLRTAVSRLIGQLAMWNAVVDGRAYDFSVEHDESVVSMRERLATSGPEFVTLTDRLVAEARLDETFVDAMCEPAEVFTYGGMLAHVLAFGATRRTLAIGALHTLGVTGLGAGDPMHWVAEPA